MAGMTIFFCWLGGGPSSEMLFIASPKSRLSATSGLSFTSTFHIHIHVGMPRPFCSFPWRTRTRTCPRFGRHDSHHFFYWFALRVDTREAPFHRPQISIESSIAPRTFNLASAKEKKNQQTRETYLTSTCSPCVRSCSTSDARGIAYIMPNERG